MVVTGAAVVGAAVGGVVAVGAAELNVGSGSTSRVGDGEGEETGCDAALDGAVGTGLADVSAWAVPPPSSAATTATAPRARRTSPTHHSTNARHAAGR